MSNLRSIILFGCCSLAPLPACSNDEVDCGAAGCALPESSAAFTLHGQLGSDEGSRQLHVCQRDVCRDFTLELDAVSSSSSHSWSLREVPPDTIRGSVTWQESTYDQPPTSQATLNGFLLIVKPEPVETWSFRVTKEDGTVLLDETREATYRHWSNECCGEGDVADIE